MESNLINIIKEQSPNSEIALNSELLSDAFIALLDSIRKEWMSGDMKFFLLSGCISKLRGMNKYSDIEIARLSTFINFVMEFDERPKDFM